MHSIRFIIIILPLIDFPTQHCWKVMSLQTRLDWMSMRCGKPSQWEEETVKTQPMNAVLSFAAAQMMNRKKAIEYSDYTENYSIEQRTTANLTNIHIDWIDFVCNCKLRHAARQIRSIGFDLKLSLSTPLLWARGCGWRLLLRLFLDWFLISSTLPTATFVAWIPRPW